LCIKCEVREVSVNGSQSIGKVGIDFVLIKVIIAKGKVWTIEQVEMACAEQIGDEIVCQEGYDKSFSPKSLELVQAGK
jgi:hypothetical protein